MPFCSIIKIVFLTYCISIYYIYSRRKYYCYHQNAKSFLLPFKNDIFSNIAIAILDFSLLLPIQLSLFQICNKRHQRKVTVIFSLSGFRVRESDNYRYGNSWKSENFREGEPSKKKQRTDTKKSNNVIVNDWMATYLFRILVVAIIFSPTVQHTRLKLITYLLQNRLNKRYSKKDQHLTRHFKQNGACLSSHPPFLCS